MAKQLNVSLAINANTSQAKQQIQSLVTELNRLGTMGDLKNLNLTPQLTEAKMAAAQLGQSLDAAFNVDTGKLDLNKLNTNLKKSGMSLSDYGSKLSMLGPQGQQTFSQISRAIIETEAPLRRSNGLLKEFGTTMMNTARWQISSSILHGFIGALQDATGYAKDLDKSLNNIRIVTGYGTDEMARFAKQANSAAKALSSTTTEYTNASLIYYQQGLSAEEVKERTEVTIKMANAAGQSAEVVSDQMTAVWNNFADGTKSLEYYADVMTALGAATASSTDEIAGGLEKFAAIGETIGLSYEYAASALATITSNTRQSEEVVGTALKTIFARIQGLQLGETLEDGTELNKYSEALQKVGIDIFDSAGEMKKMDIILDEMASKWGTLSKAQQAALAQTVAGVRQYTQLIALMENWNDGSEDSMMANLSTSYGSLGTLNEQQKIYEESWEASKERVQASLEGIYDSILDEDLFIGINDSLAETLGLIERMIDSFGGLPGILSVAGILITSIFRDELAGGINNALHNFKNFSGASKAELDTMKQKAYEYTMSLKGGIGGNSELVKAENTYIERTYLMQKEMERAVRGTNAAQQEAITGAYDLAKNYAAAALEAAKVAEQTKNAANVSQKKTYNTKGEGAAKKASNIMDMAVMSAGEEKVHLSKELQNMGIAMGNTGEEVSRLKSATLEYQNASNEFYSLSPEQLKTDEGKAVANRFQLAANNIEEAMQQVANAIGENAAYFDDYNSNLTQAADKVSQFEFNIESMQQTLMTTPDTSFSTQLKDLVTQAKELGLPMSEVEEKLLAFNKLGNDAGPDKIEAAWKEVVDTFKSVAISADDAEQAITELAIKNTTQRFVDDDSEVGNRRAELENEKSKKRGRSKKKINEKSAQVTEAENKVAEKMGPTIRKLSKNTEEYTKALHQNSKAQVNKTKIDEKAKEQQEKLTKAMEDAKRRTKDFGQGLTGVMQGTSQLSMGIFSLKSAFDALNDPDMSTFDKFTSILMSMSMGLPSLVGGLGQLRKGFSEIVGSLGGSTTTLLAHAMGLDAVALAEQKAGAEAAKSATIVKGKLTTDMQSQLTNIKSAATTALKAEAQEEENEETAKSMALTLGDIAMTKMQTMAEAGGIGAKIASTGATITQTLAQWGLNTAIAPFIGLMLAAVAAMLPYIAAAGALAAAIYFIVDAYNADAEAAAMAQEQVDNLTTTYEECKSAAEELKTTISNWEGGIEALEKLDKNTEEYKQKLKEVNDQAKELIETYGLYDKYTVEDGVITFNPGVLEGLQNEKDKQANDVETQLYAAKMISNKANVKSQGTNLGRDIGSLYDAQASEIAMQSGGGPVYRTASSTEMQQVANALDNLVTIVDGEEVALDVEQVRKALESGIDGLPAIINDNLSNLSDEDIQAIIDFRNSMNEATAANKYYAEQIMRNQIENKYSQMYENAAKDDKGNVNQGLYESMLNAGTKFASEHTKVNGKNLEETLNDIDTSKATSNANLNKHYNYKIENDEDLAKTYAREVLGWSDNDFSYQSGTNKGTLTNAATGAEMTLDDDMMRQALARESQVDDVTESFQAEIDKQMDAFNDAMTNVARNSKNDAVATEIIDAAGSTDKQIDYSALVHQISPSELIDMGEGGMTSEEIMSTLGLSDADLKAMGLANGQEFIDGLQSALLDYDPEQFYENMKESAAATAGAMAQEAGFKEEDVADIQEYSKHLMEMAESSDVLADSLLEDADAAAEVATYTARMNRGIDTLADNFEDWNSILKKSDKSSMEYSKALSGMKSALSDVLGVEQEYISNDFVTEHMDDIKLAAEGNAEAIDRLAIAAGRDIIVNMKIEGGEEVREQVLALHDELAAEIPNIEVGATLDSGDFMTKAAQIVEQAGMSVEQANAYFRSMGFEPTFETKTVPITREVKAIETTTEILEWGQAPGVLGGLNKFPTKIRESSQEVSNGTVTEDMEVPALTTDGGKPNFKLTRTNAGSMNNYSSSNKGGKAPGSKSGGSKKEPKKADKVNKSEVVERYKEIEDSLDDLRDTMEDTNKAADRLYGNARLKQMEKANKLLQKEIELTKQKKKEAEAYLKQDKIDLNKAASNAGVSFQYDESGNIINYTTEMEKLYQQLDAEITKANADGNADENEQKRIDAIQEKIDELKEAMEQYEETRELIEDLDNELDDKFYEWQDNNAEMLNYKLEIDIELNDDELRELDYYLGKTEDDFFQRAEAAGLMNQKLGVYTDNLDRYNQQYEELNQAYKNGEISQEAYIEGLNEINDGIYDNLENIQELDKEMMHYYGETLAAAGEEIDKITARMEHQTAVLEHYQSIVELAGKSTDYKKMGTVLEGKAETTKNEMIAAQEEYELYRQQADEKYALWKSAKTKEEAEMYKQQYEDALAAADEAQEEYLSKAEAYAESLKEILENSLNEYAQSLENALTGGTSFDQMNAKLERAASLQEEYLTTTNKIYETNKLMNQAQQEIDKTSNTVAKRKLKSFIDETNQLQQQGKLSQYELEIQQAKYDLLLAEIALEEAQQSKSTVRLQRDSEGNFGYVYTADQDQIAAAQQELADKQNSLYNIALEGANGYAEKYMSTLNEMYDTLTDLQQQYLSGAFESEEEYHAAVTAAKEYYYAKLEEYSDLHSIAIAADTRVIEDAWSSEFNTMIGSTETWKDAVEDYVDDTAEAFRQWDKDMDTLTGEMGLGGDLSNLSNAVEDVKNESDDLLITLGDENSGLIGAINKEIDAVDAATGIYALHRAEILQTAAAYEKLAKDIQAVKVAEGKENDSSSSSDTPEQNTGTSAGDNSSGNSGTGNTPSLSIGSAVQVKSGTKWYETSGGKGASGTAHDGEITLINSSGSHAYHIKAPSGKGMGWIKKTDIVGYDTGGYTGEWGSYGKMAMLHEKELILNARDTENFLSSIELLDNIVKTIDLQAANSQLGGLLKSPSFGNLLQQQQTLEQNVKIEASFPNVQNRTEIEEAFETLVNRASQYANRK